MELRKVIEIFNYMGDMWYINPYIENGKIVRNTTYKVKSNQSKQVGVLIRLIVLGERCVLPKELS